MQREIKEFECPKCGCMKSYVDVTLYSEAEECVKCGEMTYYHRFKETPFKPRPTVTCPYCNSTNTKKISAMSKAGSVALWGIFALGKTSKQWHCNNCKSDF